MSHPLPALRAIGFDLDGTLIDTAPDLAAAVNGMLAELDARTLPYAAVRAMIGNGVEQLVRRALRASLGDEAAAHALQPDALVRFRRAYGARLFAESRLYAGVRETLRVLAGAGLALCCLTNKHSTFTIPLLQAAGLDGVFAFTLCADGPEDRKPQPNLLLAALQRLALQPREMLYVGDSPGDAQAARAAGCRSALVTYGYGRSDPAVARADIVLNRFEELERLAGRPLV
jgi:phosphoglycolate phosphatase